MPPLANIFETAEEEIKLQRVARQEQIQQLYHIFSEDNDTESLINLDSLFSDFRPTEVKK